MDVERDGEITGVYVHKRENLKIDITLLAVAVDERVSDVEVSLLFDFPIGDSSILIPRAT